MINTSNKTLCFVDLTGKFDRFNRFLLDLLGGENDYEIYYLSSRRHESSLTLWTFDILRGFCKAISSDIIVYGGLSFLEQWLHRIMFWKKQYVLVHNHKPHDRNEISKGFFRFVNSQLVTPIFLSHYVAEKFENKNAKILFHPLIHSRLNLEYFWRQDDDIKLIFLGTIRNYKGLVLLNEALSILNAEGHSVSCDVYGQIIDDFPIDLLYLNHAGAKYTFEEIAAERENYDMAVMPYLSATQSGLPPDYFNLKLPVVATNVGAISEQIPTSLGMVVDLNPIELAKAILCVKIKSASFKDELFEDYLGEFSPLKFYTLFHQCISRL
jgi:glycosyltransferase involved in cell wall biosynthesis